jgi:phenylalanine-4-hydroxylase
MGYPIPSEDESDGANTDAAVLPRQGLTTTKAPFIEVARSRGELYIEQPYELYSEENHEAWRRLYARIQDRWQRYATEKFLEGVSKLCLDPNRVPRLDDVNRCLAPLTGFKAKAVSGLCLPISSSIACADASSRPRLLCATSTRS